MRVSTIESFFDLVFVFTITQLTYLVAGAHGPLDFRLVLLVLMLIWWMYDAYAWLTNEAGAGRPMRLARHRAKTGAREELISHRIGSSPITKFSERSTNGATVIERDFTNYRRSQADLPYS